MGAASRILAVSAVLAAGSVARADDPQSWVDRGTQLLDAGSLEEARAAFAHARELAPDRANPYRLLGIVDARLGRCADAIGELDTFLARVQPGDPRVREVVTIRDRCKEDIQPKVGTLVVESTPAGATVRLDEAAAAPVGETPYRNAALPAGAHVVYLSRPGYKPVVRAVSVGRSETVRLELSLEAEAAVPVASVPEAAVRTTQAATTAASPARKPRYWIIGVAVGAAVAGALAVGLGVGLSARPSGTTLDAIKAGP